MKKLISVVLIVVLIIAIVLSLRSCGTPEVELINSYMVSDSEVFAEFKNVGWTTIHHIKGRFNLFTGPSDNFFPEEIAWFEWNGACKKGGTILITAEVNNPQSGLEIEVNRIGHQISEID